MSVKKPPLTTEQIRALSRSRQRNGSSNPKKPCGCHKKVKHDTVLDTLIHRCINCQIDGKPGCDMYYRVKATPCKVKDIIKNFPCHIVEEVKTRRSICEKCPHTKFNGDKCTLRNKCCFGSWRAKPASVCPDNPPRWKNIQSK
tara:strand:+ start:111 stop:539 length:429 start_codon:yes stop_codon:yes gene_type:complete